MSFAAFLFVFLLAVSFEPVPAWAQITPSTLTPDPSNTTSLGPQSSVLPEIHPESSGIGFVAQDTVDPVQNNNTSANITQLATIPPTTNNEPITPSASFVPVSKEVADQSTVSNSDDDSGDGGDDSGDGGDDSGDGGDDSGDGGDDSGDGGDDSGDGGDDSGDGGDDSGDGGDDSGDGGDDSGDGGDDSGDGGDDSGDGDGDGGDGDGGDGDGGSSASASAGGSSASASAGGASASAG